MHLRLQRAAARVAVFGGILALGLGSAQASLAQPALPVFVPCSTTALVNDMTSPANGTILILAPHCTYTLTAQLPTVMHTLTIVGHFDTWITRSEEANGFSIFVVGCSTGNLYLINVNVSNGGGTGEEAAGVNDGGALYVGNGAATIHGGIFDSNSSRDYGGAIANFATLKVTGAIFTDNGSAHGGAIYSSLDGATIFAATFRGNTAYEGGAIYNDDYMTVNGSTFTHNGADYEGGAIFNAYDLTVNGSKFSANDAEYGGALFNDDTLTVNASSIGLNTAYDGAGLYNDEGIANFTGGIFLLNKASDEGGGIYVNYDGDETVTLTGTNMMFNTPDNCYPTGDVAGC